MTKNNPYSFKAPMTSSDFLCVEITKVLDKINPEEVALVAVSVNANGETSAILPTSTHIITYAIEFLLKQNPEKRCQCPICAKLYPRFLSSLEQVLADVKKEGSIGECGKVWVN